MQNAEQMEELSKICNGAKEMPEGGYVYVYLPALKLPIGCEPREVEGLLRPGPGPDGYETRLFLSAAFPNKGQNWTTHRILEKTWYTPSFNYIPADLRLIEILANHLTALR
jgi:hypothetical protein